MFRKRGFRIAVSVAALAVGSCVASVAFADESKQPAGNTDPAFIQVYGNNVENLAQTGDTCPGDWKDFIYYMKDQKLAPDLYLVEQLNGAGDKRGDLGFLIARMEKEFGQDYSGVVAQKSPGPGPKKCAPEKGYQTNGIIFRTDRFEQVKADNNTWLAESNSSGSCANSTQDRTRAVKVKLHDKLADKTLTAATVHWPTKASGGPPCAGENAKETAAEITQDGYEADQLVLGGDMNYTDAASNGGDDFRSWYEAMNGDLGGGHGFRDAVFSACAAADSPAKCRADNWSINGNRRIDFLMAKTGAGKLPKISDVHVPTFNEGDAADKKYTGTDNPDVGYSDHRAVQARIHY